MCLVPCWVCLASVVLLALFHMPAAASACPRGAGECSVNDDLVSLLQRKTSVESRSHRSATVGPDLHTVEEPLKAQRKGAAEGQMDHTAISRESIAEKAPALAEKEAEEAANQKAEELLAAAAHQEQAASVQVVFEAREDNATVFKAVEDNATDGVVSDNATDGNKTAEDLEQKLAADVAQRSSATAEADSKQEQHKDEALPLTKEQLKLNHQTVIFIASVAIVAFLGAMLCCFCLAVVKIVVIDESPKRPEEKREAEKADSN